MAGGRDRLKGICRETNNRDTVKNLIYIMAVFRSQLWIIDDSIRVGRIEGAVTRVSDTRSITDYRLRTSYVTWLIVQPVYLISRCTIDSDSRSQERNNYPWSNTRAYVLWIAELTADLNRTVRSVPRRSLLSEFQRNVRELKWASWAWNWKRASGTLMFEFFNFYLGLDLDLIWKSVRLRSISSKNSLFLCILL